MSIYGMYMCVEVICLCVTLGDCSINNGAGVTGSDDRNMFLIFWAGETPLSNTHTLTHTPLYFISELGKHLSWLKAGK